MLRLAFLNGGRAPYAVIKQALYRHAGSDDSARTAMKKTAQAGERRGDLIREQRGIRLTIEGATLVADKMAPGRMADILATVTEAIENGLHTANDMRWAFVLSQCWHPDLKNPFARLTLALENLNASRRLNRQQAELSQEIKRYPARQGWSSTRSSPNGFLKTLPPGTRSPAAVVRLASPTAEASERPANKT